MMNNTKVIKRDGTSVPFDSNKIKNAIYKACKSVYKNQDDCEKLSTIISTTITTEILQELSKNPQHEYTVESLQDIVVDTLIKNQNTEVSTAYILYREKRNQYRNLNSDLNNKIKELTFSSSKNSNLKRDNGNVNGDSAMGMMLQYGSNVSKEFTDTMLLSEDVKEAVKEGKIYIHDKDFYPMGTLTCLHIPLDKLFKKGFNTGHGCLRPPQRIESYASLTTVAIQANQNDMHGGQAIPLFDFYLAPGITKSYIKNLEAIMKIIYTMNNTYQPAYETDKQIFDSLLSNKEYTLLKNKDLLAKLLNDKLIINSADIENLINMAIEETEKQTYQAMESLIHNLNTLHTRAGSQVPFSSLNFGMDTSEEGRMVSRNLMKAHNAGLGQGETPIFPILIFQVKEGVNYNPEDPNYDLFKQSMKVSAKRMFPNYVFVDAPFNLQYYDEKDPETIIATMGCVDGKETVDYIFNDVEYKESIRDMYKRLKNETKMMYHNESKYLDLSNLEVYVKDSHESINGLKILRFVKCRKLIKNKDQNNWMRIQFSNGQDLYLTEDHPLPIKETGRTYARDIQIGQTGYVVENNICEEATIISIEKIGYRNRSSYDLETITDYFDVSQIVSHNCRTRVIGNVNGKQTPVGRGNLSFTTINLPRLGIEHGINYRKTHTNKLFDEIGFFNELDELIDICIKELLERYNYQKQKRVKNFPFLMQQGLWTGSEKLSPEDVLNHVIDSGTLSVGFIGLAECLVGLIGYHHGENVWTDGCKIFEEKIEGAYSSQELGLKIIQHMRDRMDEETQKTHLNFSLLATPAEGLSGFFTRIDKSKYGEIPGVTDREYYTNSFHIPVYFPINCFDKIDKEAPYHNLTNAGHITYVEMDGDPQDNLEAFESVIRCMKESGIGYGAINHPIDIDPICGYTGVIEGNICPNCGRDITKPQIKSIVIPLSEAQKLLLRNQIKKEVN